MLYSCIEHPFYMFWSAYLNINTVTRIISIQCQTRTSPVSSSVYHTRQHDCTTVLSSYSKWRRHGNWYSVKRFPSHARDSYLYLCWRCIWGQGFLPWSRASNWIVDWYSGTAIYEHAPSKNVNLHIFGPIFFLCVYHHFINNNNNIFNFKYLFIIRS